MYKQLLDVPASCLPESIGDAKYFSWKSQSDSKFTGTGVLGGQNVIGKVLLGGPLEEPCVFGFPQLLSFEFFIADFLSGWPQFPLLLASQVFHTKCMDEKKSQAAVAMVMPVYNKEPKKKNVVTLASSSNYAHTRAYSWKCLSIKYCLGPQ